jgi:predicted DNA-binding transcriptional regulator AlpA
LTAQHERATVTIPEFARRFGIARSTAYTLAQRDALPVPVIRLGRRMVVSRELMERVLAGQTVRMAGGDA